MSIETNPLRQYFRQPAIYVKLPSQGRFWIEGSLAIPPNTELPVFPMTAVDEITTRTPDALFNGSAVVNIIESCVPAVKDAWATPSTDVDMLLVAVRIATYGHNMDIETKCPKCGHEHDYGLDLRQVLEAITAPDYDTCLSVNGLNIYFHPLTYRQLNENSQLQFEDQKLIHMMSDTTTADEEKIHLLSQSFLRITQLTIRNIAQSIAAIKTPDTTVNDQAQVEEFLNNCERGTFAMIRDQAVKLKQTSELKPLKITCVECSNEFQQTFTLDMSNFFATNS